MQVVSAIIPVSGSFSSKFSMASFQNPRDYTEQVCDRQLVEEIERKMVLTESTEAVEDEEDERSEMEQQNLKDADDHQEEEAEAVMDEDQDEDEEEVFSFVCVDPDGSPISADDIFYDGQIRPMYPLFNQELIFGIQDCEQVSTGEFGPTRSPRPQQLRKIFVKHPSSSSNNEADDTIEGTFCEWSGEAKERCKKSNSTGFSKVWRFRDLLHRSSSDGKDAFVFLHPSTAKQSQQAEDRNEASSRKDKAVKTSDEASSHAEKPKGKKSKKPVSALDRHYMRNRVLKEEEKRRSYLPYKVGFFTSVSGLSRNVHPF